MKKNFLLLLLLTLLPLAGWAQTAPTLASTIAWDGNSHQLITSAAGLPGGYNASWTGGWQQVGGYGGTWYNFDRAGIQYYVQEPGGDAPVNGYITVNNGYFTYQDEAMSGFYNIADATATAPGTYSVWYRIMRDHANGSGTNLGNWTKAGEVTIKIDLTNMPHYVSGPQRKTGLVYNDEEHELITAGTQFCDYYDQAHGGVEYVVKTTHALPTTSDPVLTTLPKGKDAGTYYVYYRVLKDDNIYTTNSPWNEVGIGGIEIAQRPITTDDFTVTYAEGLIYNGSAQNLVTGITWKGGIDRTATAPNGKVEYVVQYEEETPATAATAEGTNAGAYKVQVAITGDDNHIGMITDAQTVNIAKATVEDIEFTPEGFANLVYNGADQQLLKQGYKMNWNGAAFTAFTSTYTLDGTDYTNDYKLPKGKNVGDYKITLKVVPTDTKNFNSPIFEGEVTVKIAKADWTLNTPEVVADFPYDGTEQPLLKTPVEAKGFGTDEGVVHYFVNGVETPEADVKAMDVGTYKVTYTVDGTDNYNEVTEQTIGTVEISKIKLHMGTKTLDKVITDVYDFENGKFILTAADFLEPDYSEFAAADAGNEEEIMNGLVQTDLDINNLNVGGNTVQLSVIADKNYEAVLLSNPVNATLNIAAIPVVITDPVGETGLEYNGEDQALVATAATIAPEKGKIVYSLSEDKDFAEGLTALVGKDAGKYNVYYKVELSDEGEERFYEYTEGVKSIPVEIAPKALADGFFTLGPDNLVYNGEDQKSAVTVTAVDGDPNIITADDFEETKVEFDGAEVTEMVNAGEYTFTFTGKKNYTGTAVAKITIAPKEISADDFAFDPESAVYDGDDWLARVEVVSDLEKDVDYTVTLPAEMTMAGDYTYTFEGIGNYTTPTDGVAKTFTVSQAENAVTVEIEDWTYGEPANDPVTTATFAAAGEPTITYATAEEPEVFGTYSEIVNDQAGSYIVKASVAETPEWAAAEATAEFEIAKAESKITPPTFAKNLTYNGLEQALLSAGAVVPEDGKVTYAVNGGEESKDIPVAKNVGKYEIVTTYTPDDNHKPATVENITVEIHPVVLTFALANVEKTWDGEKLTAEQVDKLQGSMYGELQAEDEYEPPFTLSLPEELKDVTDAGTYNFTQMVITWEEEGVENYNIKFSGTGLIQINKADLVEGTDYTAPTAVPDLVFSGEAQALVTEGAMINEYGTIQFATEKEGTYAETVPTGTDAAEYSVFFKVAGDKNHNDTEPVEIKNTIAPKAWTPVLAAFGEETEIEKTYTGEPVLTDEELVLFDGKTELEADKDYELAIDPEGLTNVGEYTLTYTGKGNYTGEAVYTVTIVQAAITAEAPKAIEGLKYTAAEQTLIEAGGEPSFGTMVYSLDGETYAEELPVGKDAGTYKVWYKVDGDDNHAALAPAFVEVTIATLPVIVTAPDVTKAYNGKAGLEGAKVGEFVYNGVLANDKIELAGDVADYLIVDPSDAKVGTYTIKVDKDAFDGASVNYQITATIDGKLTITQAEDKVTINVAEGFKFTKVYGDAGVVSVPELVVEGAAEEDVAAIKAGVELKKNDYDENVGTQKDAYSLVAKTDAKVFENYKNVVFGTVDMEITKAPLIVSIKAQDKAYDGKPAEIEITEKYISEMIAVEGLKFDDTAAILVGKVTATVADGSAVNVGEYNIALEGELENYDITPILGTYNIVPAEVTYTLTAQKVQQGKTLDETAFTAEGIAEGDEEFFYVDAPGLVDADGKVTGDPGVYKEGLVLAVAEDVIDNYTLVEAPAELEIISAEAIIIADNEDWITEELKNVDVTFADRKINAGTWNVIALPFATTVKEVSDAFGYAAVDVLNEAGTTPGEVHFQVISSGSIPAYTPFIIKTTDDEGIAKTNFNQVTFHNVNIEAWPEAKNNAITDAAGNEFIGTFMAKTPIFGQDMWYMTKGAWYDARKYTEATALTLKAFRAYIHFIEVPAEGARVFIEEPDGSITAINGLQLNNNEANAEGWYTVNGMKLDAAPTQKGTYINNGKKVIVK